MDKREFIKSTAMMMGAAAISPTMAMGTRKPEAFEASIQSPASKIKIKKSLVFGMIKEDASLVDKFKIARDAGFDGVELNVPVEFDMAEVLKAKQEAGIELPSAINRDHWSKPLSSPDPQIRKQCVESIIQSLREVKAFGGDTLLVVPGVVNDRVGYEEAYHTALTTIRSLIPYVEETGVQIGLENVWSNFMISPLEAKHFIEEINHPLIGWYFDIGNVLRYGWPEHWIRTLYRRIMKLHVKEFSRERMNNQGLYSGFKVDLLEGDNNWPVVMQALKEIDYAGGWMTAEVEGGNREELKKIAKKMDEIIGFL